MLAELEQVLTQIGGDTMTELHSLPDMTDPQAAGAMLSRLNTLERAPRKDEQVHVPGYRLECIDGSGSRITRVRIVEAARVLFNRHGFEGVTIDDVMQSAGLTRGGFYSHFDSKEQLYGEAVASFLAGRGAQWREEAGVDASDPGPDEARRMIASYLSSEHLGDLDGQCPMIALPSDVARAGPEIRASYEVLLEAMIGLFEESLRAKKVRAPARRRRARALAALCVGGMVLARTLPDSALAEEIRRAARATAEDLA